MARAPAPPTAGQVDERKRVASFQQSHFVTPGKVAVWIFPATELMFVTGLIGSSIVLWAGSPPSAYSDLYPAR